MSYHASIVSLMGDDVRKDLFDVIAESAKNDMTFVEVGVFTGGSFCYLGGQIKSLGKRVNMYAVDTFEFDNVSWESQMDVMYVHGAEWRDRYYDLFLHNVEQSGIKDVTTIISMDSIEASKTFDDKSVDFIHIDGCHGGDYVEQELHSWLPKMKDNSVVSGHDYKSIRKGNISPIDSVFGDKVKPVANGESYLVTLGKGLK